MTQQKPWPVDPRFMALARELIAEIGCDSRRVHELAESLENHWLAWLGDNAPTDEQDRGVDPYEGVRMSQGERL